MEQPKNEAGEMRIQYHEEAVRGARVPGGPMGIEIEGDGGRLEQ